VTPDTDMLLRTAGALAILVVPIWLAMRALRGGRRVRPGRRLALEEALALDPRRRLLLVRCDGRGLLLLTGGTQDAVLGWLPEQGAR
jgi:flagellar protein FliO/FliZ